MMLSQLYTILPLLASLALAGDLQIKQDTSVARTKGHDDGQWVWSSIADLEKKDKISDDEMIKVAHEASLEMRSSWGSVPKSRKPSVMTVMEIDNQLYMASSMKGDYSFIYEYKNKNKEQQPAEGAIRKSVPKEIADVLGDAKSAGNSESRNNAQHKNDASCGELIASYTYLLKNSGQSLKDKKPKRTVAWLHTADNSGTVSDKPWDPCGTDDKVSWGCDLFCKHMNFETVDIKKNKEAKELPKIAKTTQQKLMTPELRKELDEMNKQADDEKKKKQQEESEKRRKDKEAKKKEWEDKQNKKEDKKEDKEEKKEDKKEDKEQKKEDKKEDKKDKRGMTARSWSA